MSAEGVIPPLPHMGGLQPDLNLDPAMDTAPDLAPGSASASAGPASAPAMPGVPVTERLYMVVDVGTAAQLATYSGSPFNRLGQGAQAQALAGDILSVPPQHLEHADADHGASTSFSPGDKVKLKLNPWVAGKGGVRKKGKIANVRAQIGAVRLPQSKLFVDRLRNDVDALLSRFEEAWNSAARKTARQPITECFEDVWLELGWQFVHIAQSEEIKTRRKMHDSVTRVLVDAAAKRAATGGSLLQGVGAFLALYVYWATSPPVIDESEVNYNPMAPLNIEDYTSSPASPENKLANIGQGWRIDLPADVLSYFARLPDLLRSSQQAAAADNSIAEAAEDLREVLLILVDQPLAQIPSETTNTIAATRAFYIIPPTSQQLEGPRAIVTNELQRQADNDAERRRWGWFAPGTQLQDSSNRGLTRSEVVRASVAEFCAELDMLDSQSGILQADGTPGPASVAIKRVDLGPESRTASKKVKAVLAKVDPHLQPIRYRPREG